MPPPTARTPPPPPNFRKFGLGLPTTKQAQAQPRSPLLTFIAPGAGDHPTKTRSSRSALPPACLPGLRVMYHPACSPSGPPGKGRQESDAQVGSRWLPAPGTHAAHAPLPQLRQPLAPPGPRAPPRPACPPACPAVRAPRPARPPPGR